MQNEPEPRYTRSSGKCSLEIWKHSRNAGYLSRDSRKPSSDNRHYCPIELATDEKTLFELVPINRIVPTTRTRITASMTAYSAIS
jgi:hypothetical protein